MKDVASFQYLTQDVHGFDAADLVHAACEGGVKWVQLRLKNTGYYEFLPTAIEVKKLCSHFGTRLIIDDQIDIAYKVGADGVHLGKEDRPPQEAREILGKNSIIGGTANTYTDVCRLTNEGWVDYIGLGPFRYTTTKEKLSPVLGAEGLMAIMSEYHNNYNDSLPVVAIGGIRLEDVDEVMATGVDGIAVSSAVNLSIDKGIEAMRFVKKLQKKRFN